MAKSSSKTTTPPPEPELVKTGECYSRDEDGNLWIAESYVDQNGQVTTQSMKVDEQ